VCIYDYQFFPIFKNKHLCAKNPQFLKTLKNRLESRRTGEIFRQLNILDHQRKADRSQPGVQKAHKSIMPKLTATKHTKIFY
jgi:hypothetical protein